LATSDTPRSCATVRIAAAVPASARPVLGYCLLVLRDGVADAAAPHAVLTLRPGFPMLLLLVLLLAGERDQWQAGPLAKTGNRQADRHGIHQQRTNASQVAAGHHTASCLQAHTETWLACNLSSSSRYNAEHPGCTHRALVLCEAFAVMVQRPLKSHSICCGQAHLQHTLTKPGGTTVLK
jgi:hypothetical protein